MQYMVPFPQKQSENHQEKVLLWICSENQEMCPKKNPKTHPKPTNQGNPRQKEIKIKSTRKSDAEE